MASSPDDVFIHPSAVVAESCRLGPGVRIWHFCHVMEEAIVGAGTQLGQNVFVGRGVRIGERVKIQNNVSVFEGVELEDEVFCGPSVVFTNVKYPRSAFPRRDRFEKTRIGRGATLGANATILCGVSIGAEAMVGAGSVVTKDVSERQLVLGTPARPRGWVCRCGVPSQEDSGFECPECGRCYEVVDGIPVLSEGA
ncbi:MAG: DapH/DapD/GlmU-related protein [Planctomycetota bacterium]